MSGASDRLALSRRAILQQIQGRESPRRSRDRDRDDGVEASTDMPGGANRGQQPRGRFAGFKRALGAWWRHHPAHMGVELATPVLSTYARRYPLRYVGAAAAMGAVIAVTRPWRLISVTGLLVALVKSSQLSSMVMSALSAGDYPRDGRPYT